MSRRRGCLHLIVFIAMLIVSLPINLTEGSRSPNRGVMEKNHIEAFSTTGLSGKTLTAEDISIYTGIEDPLLASSCSMALGDVNGDGEKDLVVGLPHQGYFHPGEGAVHIIYSFLNSVSSLPVNGTSHAVILGNLSTRGIGSQVVIADMDGDGIDDIITTAPYSTWREDERTQYGEVFIIKGREEGIWGVMSIDDVADYHLRGTSNTMHLGRAIAVGDFNGDGKKDIAVSSDYLNSTFGEFQRGALFLIKGDGVWQGGGVAGRGNVNGSVDDELLGVSIASGDFDGDGIDDLAVSSRKVLIGIARLDGGGVHILKGGEHLFHSHIYSSSSNITVYSRSAGDALGGAIYMTDLNGDGKDDLLIGAPGRDSNGPDSGSVYILMGRSFSPSIRNLSVVETDSNIAGSDAGDRFGHSITATDVDGDGRQEVFISAPGGAGWQNMKPFSGEILSFSPEELASGDNRTAMDSSYAIQSLSYNLGSFLSSGVVNGRGVILSVAPGGKPSNDMVNKSGHIMVISLPGSDTRILLGEVGSYFGNSAVFGDFNGDGCLDLAVGAKYWSDTRSPIPSQQVSQCGGVFIFYNASHLKSITDLNLENADVTLAGSESSMLFGATLDVGDLNGDGTDDLVIGAPHASSPPFSWQAGRVFILFGNRSLPSYVSLPSGVWDTVIYGQRAGDKLGYSLGVGDVDGDGVDDLVVGAPEADGPGDVRDKGGDVYVFFGRSSWPSYGWCASLKNVSIWGAHSRDRLSYGDIVVEDLNGDGYGDIIIGSPTASPLAIIQAGETVVIWGRSRESWEGFPFGYDLLTDPAVVIAGSFRGDLLGTSLAVVEMRGESDVERALALGAPGSDGLLRNSPNCGAVYLVAVRDIIGANGTYRASRLTTSFIEGNDVNAYLGSSMSSADLDADLTDDLLIAAPGADKVFLATTPYLPLNTTLKSDILPSLIPPGEHFTLFGTSIAAGDIDSDGKTDVAIGAPMTTVEGGVGGGVVLFPDPVSSISDTRIVVHPLEGGFVGEDGWRRAVLFPTESPYYLNISMYLPPWLSMMIDEATVSVISGEGVSWANLTEDGSAATGGEGGIAFLNTSYMTVGLAYAEVHLNFTVPFTADDPARWFIISLKNNTSGVLKTWRLPLRWHTCREIAALPPEGWKSGVLSGSLPWIPGGMWVSLDPIRLVYSPYEIELPSPPYRLSINLPPNVSGDVSQENFTVRLNPDVNVRIFNATVSFQPDDGGLPPIPDLHLQLKVDAVKPHPPRDFKIYPDGPGEEGGMYDGDGRVFIDFSEGWDPWGPREKVSTFLCINFTSNNTPVGSPFEVNPGTWINLPYGVFTLSLYSADAFNNTSERVEAEVIVDPQPLAFSPISPAKEWVNSRLVNFTVEIHTGPSGVLPGSVKLQISLPDENLTSEWLQARLIESDGGTFRYCREVSLPDGMGYSVRWVAFTGSGLGPYYSDMLFFSVDTEAPHLLSSTPAMDQYVSGSVLTLTATFEDHLSMLNLSSAAFRVGPAEGIMSLPWVNLNIRGRNKEITLQGSANITFVGSSAYQWRIRDMAGNLYVLPPVPFTVDLTPPEFGNFSPPTGSVVEGDSVVVEIEIFDAGGVVPTSVEVAYSNPTTWTEMGVGIYGFGEWSSVDDVRSMDPLSLRVRAKARIPVVPGEFNYVKFRVSDRAGNVVESRAYRLVAVSPHVNHLPEVSIIFPIPFSTYRYGSEITFSANATDPDGDNLTFRWYSNRSGYLGEGKLLVKRLESGVHEITLKVSDGKGVVEKRINITVLPKPLEVGGEMEKKEDVWHMLSENPGALLAILIPGILFGLFSGYLLSRGFIPEGKEGTVGGEGGSAEPSVLITPPPKKYRCVYCGGEVREGDEYCVHCGETFTEEDWEMMRKGKRRKGKRAVWEWEEEEGGLIAVEEGDVEKEELARFMKEEEEEKEELEFEEVEEGEEEFEELEEEWEE